ncbi:MAG TPA: EAL domain-containing protein [Gammaproteobacteria bacterium]|nr:EAL domain-containing protein [Gammaproteobacteria bacterium]
MEDQVTETQLMTDLDAAVRCLHEIKALGLLVYIDDFGTGHSSLAYLRELPVDVLKIDRSFVDQIAADANAARIAASVMDLARYMDLRVIAEGVETEEQLAILRRMNCDAVQGYLFSRPVPAGQFEALFSRGRVSGAGAG